MSFDNNSANNNMNFSNIFMHFENHMSPWVWKIHGKCTFFVQNSSASGFHPFWSHTSGSFPDPGVGYPEHFSLFCTKLAYKHNISVTENITFIGGIGCLWGIKPVFMKSMESYGWWNTELHNSNVWGLAQVILTKRLEFWGQWALK